MPVITNRFLDSIRGNGKLRIIGDEQLPGFGVQVTPAGRISFCVTYRIAGKQKRRVIGRFGPMTVEQARRQAFVELGRVKAGDDPHPETPQHFATLEALYEAWMAAHVRVHLTPGSARSYSEMWRAHIRRRFGAASPTEISYSSVAAVHAELRRTPTAANRFLSVLHAMLAWAEDRRLVKFVDGNPAHGHRRHREHARERFLSVSEIRTFITDLPRAPMDESTRRALMLELHLGLA